MNCLIWAVLGLHLYCELLVIGLASESAEILNYPDWVPLFLDNANDE